jgi:hypothetical protein
MMNFTFYSCILEGRQLFFEEPFLLAASEVVRAVCKAGFQNNSEFLFEYAQPPKDGMYLFKVTRKTDGFSTLVFFDTRTKPNFIWVEKVFDNNPDLTINQFVKMLEAALNAGSYQYGWKVWLDKFVPTELRDMMLLHDAVEYVNAYMNNELILNKKAFRSIVITDAVADEVMALVNLYMKGKDSPKAIIAPLRAAKEAGALITMTKAIFIDIFGELLGNSISAIDKYMTLSYNGYNDEAYKQMKKRFAEIVEKTRLMD